MAKDTGGPDLDALVTEVVTHRNPSSHCWSKRAPREVMEFVEALQEREAGNPGTVNRKVAREIIEREWGMVLTRGQFNRHFRGECAHCGPE